MGVKCLVQGHNASGYFSWTVIARSLNFAYILTKLHQLYTFGKPLNVRGITRVLLVYINRLVCVRVCAFGAMVAQCGHCRLMTVVKHR